LAGNLISIGDMLKRQVNETVNVLETAPITLKRLALFKLSDILVHIFCCTLLPNEPDGDNWRCDSSQPLCWVLRL